MKTLPKRKRKANGETWLHFTDLKVLCFLNIYAAKLSQNQFATEKQLLQGCHISIIRSSEQNLFSYFSVLRATSWSSVKTAVSEQGCRTRGQWEEMQGSVWLIFCATKARECAPVYLTRHFSTEALKCIHCFRTNKKHNSSLLYQEERSSNAHLARRAVCTHLCQCRSIRKQKRVILDYISCTHAQTHGLPQIRKTKFRLSGVKQQKTFP